MKPQEAAESRLSDDRGSTIPLIIGFFILAGLMLVGGVVASSAFLQMRSLQSACDGAAVAATNGFERGGDALGENLPFNQQAARQAVATYAASAWGSQAAQVSIDVRVDGDRVIVQCAKTAHVPFEAVFSPGGIDQTAVATGRAPLLG